MEPLSPDRRDRLRVMHVSQPTSAGVANVVVELVRHQVAQGWDVHVASPVDEGGLDRAVEQLGAVTHEWRATRSPGRTVPDETRRLRSLVRQVRPDVLVLHSSKAGLAGRLAIGGRVPTAFMPHSWSFEAVDGMVGRASLAWEVLASRWTHLTLCVSEDERRLGERARCLGRRTLVVPNGVDVDRWQVGDRAASRRRLGLDANAPLAVCVGRLARQKGQDVLVDAWPEVVAAVPRAHLVLVGDGPDRAALDGCIAGVPSVTLVGRASPGPWFAAADVVVLPSRWEGMPLVALEAMASGRSVVGTAVSGMREALGRESAIVPVDQAKPLAAAVIRRLADPAEAAEEGRANRLRAESSFTVERAASAASEALAALAPAGRGRR